MLQISNKIGEDSEILQNDSYLILG